ncbi:hypothetical protein ACFX19_021316 [Malus domestica]
MADVENQNPLRNPPPYSQHLTETLNILLALAAILTALGMNPSHFVKPPYYSLSLVVMAALSVVWFGLFVLSARLPYRFIIWVGLALVWAIYWIILHGILAPQFFNPMAYSFNLVLAVILLFNLRFQNIWEHAIQVIAGNCGFWNYLALLCWYTGLLLQRCMDGNPRIKSYPDIGEVAYGQKGRLTISIFMYLELSSQAWGSTWQASKLEANNALFCSLPFYKTRFLASLPASRRASAAFTQPVFIAVAFYLCAKKHKLKVDKLKLIELCGASETEFSSVSTSLKDLCFDVCGTEKEKKDPKDVKGNGELLDVLPEKRKLEECNCLMPLNLQPSSYKRHKKIEMRAYEGWKTSVLISNKETKAKVLCKRTRQTNLNLLKDVHVHVSETQNLEAV